MRNTSETTLMGDAIRFTETGEFIQTLGQDIPYYDEIVIVASVEA